MKRLGLSLLSYALLGGCADRPLSILPGAPRDLSAPADLGRAIDQGDAGAPVDQAANLRAAAAGGRTAEVQALLGQGVAVDAADAYGNTALMDGIQAGHPDVAAVLRRHGASLDRKNDAGQSARDMAAAKADAALNRALGLTP